MSRFPTAAAFALMTATPLLAQDYTVKVYASVSTDIPATTMPWKNPQNPNIAFGISDGQPPVVFGLRQCLDIDEGRYIKISGEYSGVSAGPDFAPVNSAEELGPIVNGDPGSTGAGFPSRHTSTAQYYPSAEGPRDVALMELVGAFTEANGVVMGAPFAIDPSVHHVVPAGAYFLQIGFNDDQFADNTGYATVTVSQWINNKPYSCKN
ncbi:MAG: hypothetical protein ACPGNV_13535 [Mangrovicoccus sp.]